MNRQQLGDLGWQRIFMSSRAIWWAGVSVPSPATFSQGAAIVIETEAPKLATSLVFGISHLRRRRLSPAAALITLRERRGFSFNEKARRHWLPMLLLQKWNLPRKWEETLQHTYQNFIFGQPRRRWWHIVWKSLKMSHLIFGFFHQFLKLACLVTLFDRKL